MFLFSYICWDKCVLWFLSFPALTICILSLSGALRFVFSTPGGCPILVKDPVTWQMSSCSFCRGHLNPYLISQKRFGDSSRVQIEEQHFCIFRTAGIQALEVKWKRGKNGLKYGWEGNPGVKIWEITNCDGSRCSKALHAGEKAPEKLRKPRCQGSCLGFCPGKGKGAFLPQKSSQATDRLHQPLKETGRLQTEAPSAAALRASWIE